MNMKYVCKAFNDKLDGIITDSFYDEEDGGFVELDIENPADIDMDIQIEIDSNYFGFSYCSYDETHSYGSDEEAVIDDICEKIRGIIGKKICLISIETAEKSVNLLEDVSAVNNERLAEIVAECTDDEKNGCVKIIMWNTSMEKKFSFADGSYTFE